MTGSGWLTYVPRLVYEYIITSFLLPMQNYLREAPDDLDLDSISSQDGGHAPYSLKEFQKCFAEEYSYLLTNGDPSKRAVVFHTTSTRRRKRVFLGWFHVFDPNVHAIPIVSDLVHVVDQVTQSRRYPNHFWPVICNATFPVTVTVPMNGDTTTVPMNGDSTRDVLLEMSIGHIIVGKMLLIAHGEKKKTKNDQKDVLGTKASFDVSLVTTMHGMVICNRVKMKDLWPDLNKFKEYVKNCWKKTLNWQSHPFEGDGLSEDERWKLLARYQICDNYQIEMFDGGLEDALKDSISLAMEGRHFMTILQVLTRGLNYDLSYVLMSLQNHYDLECQRLCNSPTEKITSHAVAKNLFEKWQSSPLPTTLF